VLLSQLTSRFQACAFVFVCCKPLIRPAVLTRQLMFYIFLYAVGLLFVASIFVLLVLHSLRDDAVIGHQEEALPLNQLLCMFPNTLTPALSSFKEKYTPWCTMTQ